MELNDPNNSTMPQDLQIGATNDLVKSLERGIFILEFEGEHRLEISNRKIK
jgi:hypothetical protein